MSVYPVRVGVVLDGMITYVHTSVIHIMIVISPIHMYRRLHVYMCIFYLFLVQYKWCVVLSIVRYINTTASVVCLCLQEEYTAILTAALNGHLTVLRTLVEQYGGNVLHRKKVKCYMMSG